MLSILQIKAKYGIFLPEEDVDVNSKLSSVILQIFNSEELPDESGYDMEDSNILFYFGLYCHVVKKDRDKLRMYYLKAIELHNPKAMCELGNYFRVTNKMNR